jgi:tRNA nucleotidyltransferase/poly(A) polymerase|tara:strand:- start:365 stop:766 length:402 start_codon:yes stop_codon:yes gene_type:complete
MSNINKDKTYRLAWIVAVPLMVCMLLSGCSIGGEKKIKIFSVEKPREDLNYPMPTPLQMEEIKWIIITSENAEEVFKKLEEAGIDPVLFGITDKDYQVLARNFAQIRQKLQETNNLLEEYKKYYEGEDNADSN